MTSLIGMSMTHEIAAAKATPRRRPAARRPAARSPKVTKAVAKPKAKRITMAERERRRVAARTKARSTPTKKSPVRASKASPSKRLSEVNGVCYTGRAMRPMGFSEMVVVDLDTLTIPNDSVPIFYSHDPTTIIGHTKSVVVSRRRQPDILLAGVISGVNDRAKEIRKLAANGFPWQLSIGADPGSLTRIPDGDTVEVNGRTFDGPILVASDCSIYEVSIVPLGADAHTSANVTASLASGKLLFNGA